MDHLYKSLITEIDRIIYDLFPTSKVTEAPKSQKNSGSVVQNIVSLMSSLRGQIVKCFTHLTNLVPNTMILFVEKMREAFAVVSAKNMGIFEVLTF